MSLKRILKYVTTTVGIIICLLLIAAEFMERVTLPNGLYIYKTPFIPTTFAEQNFYIYNSDDELIVDKPVEFICFNDDYIEVIYYYTQYSQGYYLYEISTKKRFHRLHPDYRTMMKKSGLSSSEHGCNGYFKYNIGTNLLWMRPHRLTKGPWE